MDALSAQGNLSEARPAPDAYNLHGESNRGPPRRGAHRPYDDGALQTGPIRLADSDRVGGSIPVSTPGSIPVSAKALGPRRRNDSHGWCAYRSRSRL
jgi:hypothetical protein